MSLIRSTIIATSSRLVRPFRLYSTDRPGLPKAPEEDRPSRSNSREILNPFADASLAPIPELQSQSNLNLSNKSDDSTAVDINGDPIDISSLLKQKESFQWWQDQSRMRDVGTIASRYAGRGAAVMRAGDFQFKYRGLRRMLNDSGLKNESRRREYYEKPSEKRVRLASEYHRTRFAAMVREKVKIVELYRSRQ